MTLLFGSWAPWAVLTVLVSIFHGAFFHLLFGSKPSEVPWALGLGTLGGLFGGWLGTVIPPALLAIGDANLISITIGAWSAMAIGRLFRVC